MKNAVFPKTAQRRLGHFAIFALPKLPLAVVLFPSHAVLPGFYAEHTTISLATIGGILIVARVFDAIIDPAIGFMSDATIGRWGTRKPWLLSGAMVLALSVVPLYIPSADVGPLYFLGWFLAFYLGYSLIEVPLKAWGTELARDYVDRTRIATCLAVAYGIGNLAFAITPFLSGSGTNSYDPATLALVGWSMAVVVPFTALIATGFVPNGSVVRSRGVDLAAVLRALRANKPLLHCLTIFILMGLGQGVFYGMVYLFVGSILHVGAAFVWVLLADAVLTLLSVPLWYVLVNRMQKHRAWALGLVISAFALAGMFFLPAGQSSVIPLIALVCVRAIGAAVFQVAPNALLGDVIDYELFKRHVNQAGNFQAIALLIMKFTATIGAGAGLLIVGLAGFDPNTTLHAPGVLTLFRLVALGLPGVILLAGAAVAMRFPLDRGRHAIVLRYIERRMPYAATS